MNFGTDNVPFIDTLCHQSTFESHLHDVDCHYHELLKVVNTNSNCVNIIPYPYGKESTITSSTPPDMFRIRDYTSRLLKNSCNNVYNRYTVKEIHEAIATKHIMKPTYSIAALNTSIQFFDTTIPIPHKHIPVSSSEPRLNVNYTYSIGHKLLQTIDTSILPTYFNWMDNIDITRPMNQGTCGSCWAVAASTALSDVFVASKRVTNPNLSPGYILSCYPQQQCEGGNPFLAIRDMELHGARSNDCIPSTLPIQVCKCHTDGPSYYPEETRSICIPPDLSKYSKEEAEIIQSYLNSLYGTDTTVNLSQVPITSIQKIVKDHIYKHGPVVTGFHVFKNFMIGDFRETNDIYIETQSYQGIPGIDYNHLDTDWVGSHAVVIVGWGETPIEGTMVPYWICRNSWGENWGSLKGIFHMAMYGEGQYRNKVSQFEYPSLILSDQGYGLCGGILLIKAGQIKNGSSITTYRSNIISLKNNFILLVVIGIGLVSIIFIKNYKLNIILNIILLLIVLYLIYSFL